MADLADLSFAKDGIAGTITPTQMVQREVAQERRRLEREARREAMRQVAKSPAAPVTLEELTVERLEYTRILELIDLAFQELPGPTAAHDRHRLGRIEALQREADFQKLKLDEARARYEAQEREKQRAMDESLAKSNNLTARQNIWLGLAIAFAALIQAGAAVSSCYIASHPAPSRCSP